MKNNSPAMKKQKTLDLELSSDEDEGIEVLFLRSKEAASRAKEFDETIVLKIEKRQTDDSMTDFSDDCVSDDCMSDGMKEFIAPEGEIESDDNSKAVVEEEYLAPDLSDESDDGSDIACDEKKIDDEEELGIDAVVQLFQAMENNSTQIVLCDVPTALNTQLLPHQHVGLSWMHLAECNSQCGMLSDDQGLGKTVEAISLILKNSKCSLLSGISKLIQRKAPANFEHSSFWKQSLKQKFNNSKCPKVTLVVVPVILLSQWKHEIEHFSNGTLKVGVYHKEKKQGDFDPLTMTLDDFDVIITTYGVVRNEGTAILPEASQNFARELMLGRLENDFRERNERPDHSTRPYLFKQYWYRVILDESHTVKNSRSQTYKAACKLLSIHRWCLTGTPIHNRMDELYSQLSFLSNVKSAKSKALWNKVISKPIQAGIIDREKHKKMPPPPTHEEKTAWATLNKTVNLHVLRRTKNTKDAIGTYALVPLPSKNVVIRKVIMERVEKEIYDCLFKCGGLRFEQMENAEAKKGKKRGSSNMLQHMFVWILRLRQFCDHPMMSAGGLDKELFLADAAAAGQDLDDAADEYNEVHADDKSWLNFKAGKTPVPKSSKMIALLEDITNLKMNSKAPVKMLVFSQFTEFIDVLEQCTGQAGFKSVKLDGRMSQEKRKLSIEQFTQDPKVEIFFISLRAGGLGLNLVTASHVFIMEPWWNTALEDQAVDRVHRIGQLATVQVVRYVVEETIENGMISMQEKKRALTVGTFAESFPEHKTMGMKELRNMFSLEKKDNVAPDHEDQVLFQNSICHIKQHMLNQLEEAKQDIIVPTYQPMTLQNLAVTQTANLMHFDSFLATLHQSSTAQQSSEFLSLHMTTNDAFIQAAKRSTLSYLYFHGRLCTYIPRISLLDAMQSQVSNLLSISLTLVPLETADLDVIASCVCVRELRLNNCGKNINDESVGMILGRLRSLQRISLQGAYNLLRFDPIFESGGLKEIDIEYCSNGKLGNADIGRFNWQSLETLNTLSIGSCRYLIRPRHEALRVISSADENLTGVDEICCILEMARSSLEHLNFSGMDASFTHKIADTLSTCRLVGLVSLNLRGCSKAISHSIFLPNLVKTCKYLEDLSLEDCSVATDEEESEMRRENKWKWEASAVNMNNEIDDVSFERFIETAEQSKDGDSDSARSQSFALQYDVSSTVEEASAIGNEKVKHDRKWKAGRNSLLSIGQLKNLKSLNISRVNVVDSKVVVEISKACSKLEFLDLSGCVLINSKGMLHVTQLRSLHVLKLSWCYAVTEDVFTHLVEKLKQLHYIYLWGCADISDRIVRKVMTNQKGRFQRPDVFR